MSLGLPHLTKVKLPSGNSYALVDADARAMITEYWISSKAYVSGDFCIYNDSLWRCTTSHTSTTNFDTSKWTAVTVESEIKDIKSSMSTGLHFRGYTTTALTDGSTTNPITINGSSYTAISGDIVIYHNATTSKDLEFVYDGTKWSEFGSTGTLKSLAFKDNASGSYTKPTGSGSVQIPDTTGRKYLDLPDTTESSYVLLALTSVNTANTTVGNADVGTSVAVGTSLTGTTTFITSALGSASLTGTKTFNVDGIKVAVSGEELQFSNATTGTVGISTSASTSSGTVSLGTTNITPATASTTTAKTIAKTNSFETDYVVKAGSHLVERAQGATGSVEVVTSDNTQKTYSVTVGTTTDTITVS